MLMLLTRSIQFIQLLLPRFFQRHGDKEVEVEGEGEDQRGSTSSVGGIGSALVCTSLLVSTSFEIERARERE